MKNRKRLLFYTNSLALGGAERVLIQLAGRFAADGYPVVFVTSYRLPDEYPVPDEVQRISLEDSHRSGSVLIRNLNRIRGLRALCLRLRPAVLISFLAEPNFRILMAASGLPVKTVISVRNVPEKEYYNAIFRFAARHFLPEADGCVFQTEQARAWFPEKLQKKSRVIMNQVDPRFFMEETPAERHGIVAVGRLTAQKNHAMLIRSFAALGDAGETLTIYGEGSYRSELEDLIRSLGLEGSVFLPGYSKDIARDIKGAKLFVLTSDYEGMPNVLLEAMALGLPCIATDCPCGGPATVIRDGVSGLLIPVGDEAALTEKLRELLQSEERRRALSENARHAAEAFRPDDIFRQWKEFVESVIHG